MTLAFIDTEVDRETKKVKDYGALREDGASLHTRSMEEFRHFLTGCDALCGHNVVGHDMKYLRLDGLHTVIDTLPLSPLLFPSKPYHKLLKDDKLLADEVNNPLSDAKKARDLFHDELTAWHSLPARRQTIFATLLTAESGFKGFFEYLSSTPGTHSHGPLHRPDIPALIAQEYNGQICGRADIESMTKNLRVELAYALALIGAENETSLTPPWVLRNHPGVSNVMYLLRGTPCSADHPCPYCSSRLDAHRALKEFFGHDRFRTFDGEPMQQQAVEAAIRGESILTVFPTGGGKSVTFQLPALMAGRNVHGLTVVISPLQSLMKDQVDNLVAKGIDCAVTVNGLLDPIERADAIRQVADGTANLLYISPEMLRSRTIRSLLVKRNVVRFVIDEAHCFSAWGQDFRTDYFYIAEFIRDIKQEKPASGDIAVSCFTATAKPKVVSDIKKYFLDNLGLSLKTFAASTERKNLRYAVLHTDTEEQKYSTLRNLVTGHTCPTIVYVSRTKPSRELAHRLNRDGIPARAYNGKMDKEERNANQEAFMHGDVQVIVATSAFGMGVDKKDVGLVVHYDISDSLENYVQEAGRAGRDPRMEAECYVLYGDDDLDKHFILLNQTKLSLGEIQQVWRAIKELTARRDTVSCSPLEIARKAGWNEDGGADIETRVRSAIAALGQAGYVSRGTNMPQVFATGITVRNMDEARTRLTASPLFDDQSRQHATRIIGSLISSRATSDAQSDGAESRVDYLSDVLGIDKTNVIRCINLMRQERILADTHDMSAYLDRSNISLRLEETLRLERYILDHTSVQSVTTTYKQLNMDAQEAGNRRCTVERLRTLMHFLSTQKYISRHERHSVTDTITFHLASDADSTTARYDRRVSLCRFIVKTLTAMASEAGTDKVTFSVVDLLRRYASSPLEIGFSPTAPPAMADIEEALLYLSRNALLRIDGGFMVIYNTMRLHRTAERTRRYGKEQYRLFDEFYRHRIQQIHIVGQYANMMVHDYNAALQFVSDYFQIDYRAFLAKYFSAEQRTQINKNITPGKFNRIFGTLSPRQREIIDDKDNRLIVVAAGPGSGKTRVLVHKLASLLLLEDIKAEGLLMLTFSRAAATEFKKRLIDLVGNAAHFVDIKTFHSYSFDLIGYEASEGEFSDIVRRAATMIENGEVEDSKVSKSVLVIDEAQDMSADDFRLVQALMRRNEDMRLIAVGDDDQNIYAFRGSDSAHLRSLISRQGATLYELTENYRSDRAIVDYANHFAQRIPGRMKRTPITAVSTAAGTVRTGLALPGADAAFPLPCTEGTTAVLCRTNEQALLLAYRLRRQGCNIRLVQGNDSFKFYNLAEVRYFLKQFGTVHGQSINRQQWNAAKDRTRQKYRTSTCLPAIDRFFAEFEATHHTCYYSDLLTFIRESEIEDFLATEAGTVFVGTIHKAKGREFDNVYLVLDGQHTLDPEALRTVYVGITRARHTLSIYPSPSTDATQPSSTIILPLGLKDVWLDYFRDRKQAITDLRSGDTLLYRGGYLLSRHGESIASLSTDMRRKVAAWEAKGYTVDRAEVSYIVAWRKEGDTGETAVCLANLTLTKGSPAA